MTDQSGPPTAPQRHANEPPEGLDYWGEHPKYPVSDWADEVSNDDTRQGYWAWCESQREAEEADAELTQRESAGDAPDS